MSLTQSIPQIESGGDGGGGTVSGSGTVGQLPAFSSPSTLTSLNYLFNDGTGLGLGLGGTQYASLRYFDPNPGVTDPSLVITAPDASGILNFCFDADKNFDWAVPAVPNPLFFFRSKNQVLNEYVAAGIAETGGTPDRFLVILGGGDDLNGTPRTRDGFDYYEFLGGGGTLLTGGRGGDRNVRTGDAGGTGNNRGGDFNITLGTGTGTGRRGQFHIDGTTFLDGSVLYKYSAIPDTDATASEQDSIVAYTSLTATRTLTLPSAATMGQGGKLIIKDESGNASLATSIIVDGAGAETIDGAASISITAAYGVLRVYSNGTNWMTR